MRLQPPAWTTRSASSGPPAGQAPWQDPSFPRLNPQTLLVRGRGGVTVAFGCSNLLFDRSDCTLSPLVRAAMPYLSGQLLRGCLGVTTFVGHATYVDLEAGEIYRRRHLALLIRP